jgi:hypothetical protein
MKSRVVAEMVGVMLVFGLFLAGCVTTNGTKSTPAKYFLYTKSRYTKHATITRYIGRDTDVVIPKELRGSIVDEIKNGAFANRSDITSITIPYLRNGIGETAFDGCTGVTRINNNGRYSSVIINGLRLLYPLNYTQKDGNWFYLYSGQEIPVAKMAAIVLDDDLSILVDGHIWGGPTGFYITPGLHTIEMKYSSSRKNTLTGAVEKTRSQGTSTLTVDMSAGMYYYVSGHVPFDRSNTVIYSIKERGKTQL